MADRQQGGPAVFVVPVSSAACAEGMAAFVDGSAVVVIAEDELKLLPDALEAASHGFSVLSSRVVEGARRLPALAEDDRVLLRRIAGGASNVALAIELDRSMATVKRDIARLCARLGVTGRAALIGAARELGF